MMPPSSTVSRDEFRPLPKALPRKLRKEAKLARPDFS
jgi:hypothetical protein